MKFLFLILAVLVAAVGIAVVAYQDPGYVLITRADWAVETSLAFAVLALVFAFGGAYAAIRLILFTWQLPLRIRALRRYRRTARARRISERGYLQLAEGQWKQAEQELVRAADQSDAPLLNYLAAARAAQEQGAIQRRDLYLSRAHQAMPQAEQAVGLARAEAQLAQGQLDQALATLLRLRELTPKHSRVLELLSRTYERLCEWDALGALLPELRQEKVFDEDELEKLETRVYVRLFDRAEKSIGKLREVWETVPKDVQRRPEITGAFAHHLTCVGEGSESEELLREAIKRDFDAQLVRLYGLVRGRDPAKQLATAEGWLKTHERSAELLLTLGRICLQHRLWGKARTYLEASLGLEPRAETFRELAVLLQQFKEHELAFDYFRRGLELVVGTDACTTFRVEPEAFRPQSRVNEPRKESPMLPSLPR